MLKGKLLKIIYNGMFCFEIEGYKRSFRTSEDMDDCLINILRNAKDKTKLDLLKKDLEHYFKEDI
jgi:hypothetical protein